MSNRGRPHLLDENKKRQILAILAAGCERATAARALNCDPRTIATTLKRDPDFADKLALAESKSEIVNIENLNRAAALPQYWRASAWILERISPERYAKTSPDVVTPDQITSLVVQIAEIIVEEIPAAVHRKQILKRFDAVLKEADFLRSAIPPPYHNLPPLESPA